MPNVFANRNAVLRTCTLMITVFKAKQDKNGRVMKGYDSNLEKIEVYGDDNYFTYTLEIKVEHAYYTLKLTQNKVYTIFSCVKEIAISSQI